MDFVEEPRLDDLPDGDAVHGHATAEGEQPRSGLGPGAAGPDDEELLGALLQRRRKIGVPLLNRSIRLSARVSGVDKTPGHSGSVTRQDPQGEQARVECGGEVVARDRVPDQGLIAGWVAEPGEGHHGAFLV